MGKSINPMCDFLKPKPQDEALLGFALEPIVLMSLQLAIPWRVALLHCPPPLHRLDTMLHRPADFVNHHLAGAGEFSTGTMGNFQPDLTPVPSKLERRRLASRSFCHRPCGHSHFGGSEFGTNAYCPPDNCPLIGTSCPGIDAVNSFGSIHFTVPDFIKEIK